MELIKLFENEGIFINENQAAQFEKYAELLVSYNEKVNLTAITEQSEIYLKHFLDSCLPLKMGVLTENATVIDVGCGGGFPSVPLKIAMPSLRFTLMDAKRKKTEFLSMVVKELELSDVEVINMRAEEAGRIPTLREQFDFSVARAVAPLNVLMEYCVPFVKVGGRFIALKGRNAEEEILDARNAAGTLGVKASVKEEFILPGTDNVRNIVVYEKIKTTDSRYPRKTGKPTKAPL